tara:strand:+ start:194 stop:661 length:468 start_codon:yes stop_codon:yes gene_type:complete
VEQSSVAETVEASVEPSSTETAPGETSISETATSETATDDQAPADQAEESDPRTHRFECRSCGFVYDPEEGVKKVNIAVGTAFADVDALSFRCPVCRSKVAAFRDIGPRTKASGFEENLNFGFGVNRMTPGQKNVLIFGSLALGFAFFLSLYSLR